MTAGIDGFEKLNWRVKNGSLTEGRDTAAAMLPRW